MKIKKIIKYILIIIIVIILLFTTKILISFIPEKETINNEIINEQILEETNTIDIENEETELQFAEEIIGVLKIPKLEIEAEIKEGTDWDTLANYIGHFENTPIWNGNVALASHNRGVAVAHYFEGIHLLQEGDEIIYRTNLGERRYSVYNTKEISSTDWSVTSETEENILTLITCIKNEPEKRLCVQAKAI